MAGTLSPLHCANLCGTLNDITDSTSWLIKPTSLQCVGQFFLQAPYMCFRSSNPKWRFYCLWPPLRCYGMSWRFTLQHSPRWPEWTSNWPKRSANRNKSRNHGGIFPTDTLETAVQVWGHSCCCGGCCGFLFKAARQSQGWGEGRWGRFLWVLIRCTTFMTWRRVKGEFWRK